MGGETYNCHAKRLNRSGRHHTCEMKYGHKKVPASGSEPALKIS